MAEVEKKLRITAKRKFTRAYNRLIETIENKGELEIIDEKYSAIKLLWDDVQSKHEEYLFAAFPEQDEPYDVADDQWIKEVEEKFEIVQKRKYDYDRSCKTEVEEMKKSETERVTVDQLQKDTRIAESKIDVERNMFLQEMVGISQMINDDENGYLKIQISASLKDLKYRLEKCNEAHLYQLSAANGRLTENDQKWIKDLYAKFENINRICLKYFEKISKLKEERDRSSGIRLERMKLPSFSGDIRSYARFKSDFKRQVVPHTRSQDLAYTLKSCLTGEPLKVTESVDNEYEQMWDRLDNKFGRPSLLIDVIMNDIKRMQRIKDGDDIGILNLVDVVERGYSNLSRIGMEKEMSNAITLSVIEEILEENGRKRLTKKAVQLINLISLLLL